MEWKELESDIKLRSLSSGLSSMDCLSAVHLIANYVQGVRIYAIRSCIQAVWSHVNSDEKEVGGLIIGLVYENDFQTITHYKPIILLTNAVASTEYRNSSVSLEMGAGVWQKVDAFTAKERIVVGWYHSHPNLGAFFSSTDRKTQRGFFNHQYSLGLVIDPCRNEQKVFCAAQSEEYPYPILEIENGLAMVESN